MAIPKRLTESRWVISRVDPAIAFVDIEVLKEYWKSFNIETLGSLEGLDPTKVKIKPLLTKHAHLDTGVDKRDATDNWLIFSYHVEKIDDPSFQLEWEGTGENRFLSEKMRDLFPENFIEDIADMICQLANGDGHRVPFVTRRGFMDTLRNYRLHLAK